MEPSNDTEIVTNTTVNKVTGTGRGKNMEDHYGGEVRRSHAIQHSVLFLLLAFCVSRPKSLGPLAIFYKKMLPGRVFVIIFLLGST